MRGLPAILSGQTTASADDALAVLNVEPEECPAGEIMRRMLRRFRDPAVCLYVYTLKRTYGTTDPATAAALLALWGSDNGPRLVLAPSPTILGINLLWNVVEDTMLNQPLREKLANGYQRRSFNGLVNTGLREFYQQPTYPCVLVDQINGVVGFCLSDGSMHVQIVNNYIQPAGQTVCIEFESTQIGGIFE